MAAVVVTIELHWPLFADQLGSIRWLITFAVFAPAYLWTTRSPTLRSAILRVPLALLLAWAGWALVSANWSSAMPLAFGLAFGLLSTVLIGAFYAGTFGWARFARIVSITIAVFFVVGAAYRIGEGVVGSSGRFEGLAHGPTDAGRLGYVLAFTAMSGFVDRPKVRYGLAALGAVGCYAAGARTATIGLILGAGLVALRRLPRNGIRPAVAALGLAGLIILAFTVTIGGASIDFANRAQEPEEISSLTGRTEVWTAALDVGAERPIVGHGLASSNAIFDDLASGGVLSWDPGTAHNLWLNNQLQLGLVGSVLLGLAVVGLIGTAGRRPDSYRDALLLALLVNSMTEPLLHEPAVALLVLSGMAGTLCFDRAGTTGRTPSPSQLGTAASVA